MNYNVRQFLGCYFNQDWTLDYSSFTEAIEKRSR
ncbi:contact-dependent growth inhibition system immunity protein [Brucella intermedia]